MTEIATGSNAELYAVLTPYFRSSGHVAKVMITITTIDGRLDITELNGESYYVELNKQDVDILFHALDEVVEMPKHAWGLTMNIEANKPVELTCKSYVGLRKKAVNTA